MVVTHDTTQQIPVKSAPALPTLDSLGHLYTNNNCHCSGGHLYVAWAGHGGIGQTGSKTLCLGDRYDNRS